MTYPAMLVIGPEVAVTAESLFQPETGFVTCVTGPLLCRYLRGNGGVSLQNI